MTFPTTSVLDSFNRANENPLSNGGKWSNTIYGGGEPGLQLLSNQARSQVDNWGSAWWNESTFSDCEIYMTLTGSNPAQIFLWLRLGNPGSSNWTGYLVAFYPGSSEVKVFWTNNGWSALTQLGSTISQAIVQNDQVGASIIGSTITPYLNGVALGTRTQNTYSSGYIGVEANGNASVFDNFGGGALNGDIVVPINQIVESDLNISLGKIKSRTILMISETNLFNSIVPIKLKLLGNISETNLFNSIVPIKIKLLGNISEIDDLLFLDSNKLVDIGQINELDSLGSLSVGDTTIVVDINQIIETNQIQPLNKNKLSNIAQLIEFDAAMLFARNKVVYIGQISENDELFSFNRTKIINIGQINEINTSLGLMNNISVMVGFIILTMTDYKIVLSESDCNIILKEE